MLKNPANGIKTANVSAIACQIVGIVAIAKTVLAPISVLTATLTATIVTVKKRNHC